MGKYIFNPLGRYLFDLNKSSNSEKTPDNNNGNTDVLTGCNCEEILLYLKDIRDRLKRIEDKLNLEKVEYYLYWKNLEVNYDNPIQPYWKDLNNPYDNPNPPNWKK
jgi:hypothetical protein